METIGGQAILEGVMLRKKDLYTTAVRDPKGKIVTTKHTIKDHRKGLLSIFKFPLFRGMYAMYEMLTIGMKTLVYSSNVSLEEEEEKLTSGQVFWLITTSLLITLGVFVVLPYALTHLFGVQEQSRPVLFNFIDAIIKITFFVIYVWAISKMKDIKRLFQYHGAEHKMVSCYEHEKKVTAKAAKKYSRLHPRCGSSFIMLVAFISIFFFSFLPVLVETLFPLFLTLPFLGQKGILLVSRLLIIPVIAGFSFEVLRLAGKYYGNIFFKIISAPGLALQLITTAEPDMKQLEVAYKAMEPLLPKSKK